MTELFLAASLIGFASSTALAIWLVVMRGDLADAVAARTRAEHRASFAEQMQAETDAKNHEKTAQIAKLKIENARLKESRNAKYEQNAQAGNDGGDAAVDDAIDRVYPDANDYR